MQAHGLHIKYKLHFIRIKMCMEYPIYLENRLQMMNSLDVSPVQNESVVLNDYYMVQIA